MNYALKLNSSTNVLGPFRTKIKCCQERYFCSFCLYRHLLSKLNARRYSNDTKYLAMIKMLSKRTEQLATEAKFSENVKLNNKNIQKKKGKNKYVEILKVSNFKSSHTKMNVERIKPSDVKAFAEESGMTFESASKRSQKSNTSFDVSKRVLSNEIIDPGGIKTSNTLNQDGKINKHPKTANNEEKDLLNAKRKDVFNMTQLHKKDKATLTSNAKSSPDQLLQQIVNNSTKSENPSFIEGKISGDIREKYENTEVDKTQAELDPEFDSYQITKFWDSDGLTKEVVLRKHILSQLDICISCRMLDEGINLLQAWREKPIWKKATAERNFVTSYNILLKAYAELGDWNTVSKLERWMIEDNIRFNPETYACILYCLGIANENIFETKECWKKEISKRLVALREKNIFIDNIFKRTHMTKEQAEIILRTIRAVRPDFERGSTTIKLNSNCKLLEGLFRKPSKLESHVGNDLTFERIEKFITEQIEMEKNFEITIKSVSWPPDAVYEEKQKIYLDSLFEKWKEAMLKELVEHINKLKKIFNENPTEFNLYLFLKTIPLESLTQIMLQITRHLMEFSGSYSPSTCVLHKVLGDKVYIRYRSRKLIENINFNAYIQLYKDYCNWVLRPTGPAKNARQQWQMLAQERGNFFENGMPEIRWSDVVKSKLGKLLISIIIKSTNIEMKEKSKVMGRIVPVFYLFLRPNEKKHYEEIKCHPIMTRLYQKVGFRDLIFDSDQIPMLCPPVPWVSHKKGGYLILPAEYIRRPRDEGGQKTDLQKVRSQYLYAASDSLNALQAVPWIVNEEVLDVALHVFRKGGSEELSVPRYPNINTKISETNSLNCWREFQLRLKMIQKKNNMYSLWCEALYRLSLANHFRNRIFWLPQNFDFRGRVYPVPPLLNHLGSDLFRSLLLFARGKPIGERGLDWIKIHLINLTGTHKRRSIKERLAHANDVLDKIVDSAENPLSGSKWWMNSEEPWQTLAACKEIRNILMSPKPEEYVSHFPIHQDGSCNGLQHYAALGRDVIGGDSVNLTPNEVPQDVYSFIVEIIEQKRAEDAANGSDIAKALEGFVRRKVVKQTIMTTVYGVTPYGGRIQIAKQLEDIKDFPQELVWAAAGYLTKRTFESLNEMFKSAKEIQEWFIKCAEIITKKENYVKWISPIGLPVVQPYTKRHKDKGWYPNRLKQQNAFPPNFVHSLDSCHMMLTALHCEQAGVTFASIHDCFWTHPSTVDIMNEICREQFILLHSHPILQDLAKFFKKTYLTGDKYDQEAIKIFSSIPKRGDLDLNSLRDSVYFFS